MVRAAFIDRDGTIIEETHYIRDPEKVKLLPGAAEGLRELVRLGFRILVISNQSGVGRGIISSEQFRQVHERVAQMLHAETIEVSEFLYCMHTPEDNCQCRKPKTGLIPRNVTGTLIDFKQSITVGDKLCDLELGRNIGTQPFLVLTGYGAETAATLKHTPPGFDFEVAKNLVDVSRHFVSASSTQ